MIGDFVTTDEVIADLEKVRIALCAYGADEWHTCDCKFLRDSQALRPGSEQTGCCEIRQAVAHLREMSKGVEPWPKARILAMVAHAKASLGDAETVIGAMQ